MSRKRALTEVRSRLKKERTQLRGTYERILDLEVIARGLKNEGFRRKVSEISTRARIQMEDYEFIIDAITEVVNNWHEMSVGESHDFYHAVLDAERKATRHGNGH